jgi:type II secretory pathway pseudopilin PulG
MELALVLSIIAVLAAVASPQYASALARYRADAAARRVVADLNRARSEARASSDTCTVIFDDKTSSYALLGVESLDHPGDAYVVSLISAPYQVAIAWVAFDDPTSNGDSDQEVIFDGHGRPDSGGTVVISVGLESRAITLDATSGRATLQ